MTQPLPEPPVLSVSEITNAIKFTLEGNFPNVWVQGEISNFKHQTSGHLYFSLKDANAQIAAVMFQREAAQLKMPIKDGQQVLVRGEINVYAPSGRYQILIRELRPVGIGELLLKLEELKIKLHKLGWFKKERKKPIPSFPKTIGIITSPTGAAIQDMIHILTRRRGGFHLILNPVKVQGDGAAQEIAQAIRDFNTYRLADVLIVGRGGGSIEDLWAFNEEVVAQAIFDSKIPIIAAVGHETDHCIADYVADLRAPTPSAAAELVVAEKATLLHHLSQVDKRLTQSIRQRLIHEQQRLNTLKRQPLFSSPYAILGMWMQKLDEHKNSIDVSFKHYLGTLKLRIAGRQKQIVSFNPLQQLSHYSQLLNKKQTIIDRSFQHSLETKKHQLNNIKNVLNSIDPKNLLKKGYCILFSEKEDSAITSISQSRVSDSVSILLADGKLKATITDVAPQ